MGFLDNSGDIILDAVLTDVGRKRMAEGNFRIAKSHPRIMAYGTVDEANAAIGIVLTNALDGDVSQLLSQIQNDLFLLGSDLSNQNLNDLKNRVSLEMVEKLEKSIDLFELELSPLTNFILPGGNSAAAQTHQVRTIVRRAETLVVKLSDKDEINSNCIKYLNRLSDLMFVMGRLINKRKGIEDILWKP